MPLVVPLVADAGPKETHTISVVKRTISATLGTLIRGLSWCSTRISPCCLCCFIFPILLLFFLFAIASINEINECIKNGGWFCGFLLLIAAAYVVLAALLAAVVVTLLQFCFLLVVRRLWRHLISAGSASSGYCQLSRIFSNWMNWNKPKLNSKNRPRQR